MHGISNKNWAPDYCKNPQVEGSDLMKEFRCIQDNGEEDQIYYMRMKMPMMTERDNVAHMCTKRLDNDELFVQMKSVEHADYPVKPNMVRMYQSITGYSKPHPSIPNCWDYCEIDQLDLRGNFPSRLFNMVLASSCKGEMEKMYNTVKDKK